MSRVSAYEASVFSIGGTSFLPDLKSVSVESSAELAGVTPVGSVGEAVEPVRQWSVVTAVLGSTKPGGAKVTALDSGPITIGGTAVTDFVERISFTGSAETEEAAGLRDEWRHTVVVRKSYKCEARLLVDTLAGTDVIERAFAALVERKVGLVLELNGVQIELPMTIRAARQIVSAGKVQVWEMEMEGSALPGLPYPTQPLGNASLLEWAFNAPQVPLGLVLTTKATQGLTYSGSFLIERFSFDVVSGEVVDTTYRFLSRGPVSAVAT